MTVYNYDYIYDKTRQPSPNLDYIHSLIQNSDMTDKNLGYCSWNEYEECNNFGVLELFFENELSIDDKQILDMLMLPTILLGFSKIAYFYNDENNYIEDFYSSIIFSIKRIIYEDDTKQKILEILILQDENKG